MTGHATTEGTTRYRARMEPAIPPAHFQLVQGLHVSSIGLGTYLGDPDERTDHLYTEAVRSAFDHGCNLIDTAINYRFQRSERSVGQAIRDAISDGKISRDEIVISTKGGFLSFDGGYPANPGRYFHDEYIDRGVCRKEDIVANCHCMTPSYLENQLERSLANLGLECVDIYLIHNPETQLTEVSRQEFLRRMSEAFRLMEAKVQEGRIRMYGTATWDGFRHSPGARTYLSLSELLDLAREAGGEDHHFRAIQLPYNLAMPEAFLSRNQRSGDQPASLIEAASRQNMVILCSASILQGQLARHLPNPSYTCSGTSEPTPSAVSSSCAPPPVSRLLSSG